MGDAGAFRGEGKLRGTDNSFRRLSTGAERLEAGGRGKWGPFSRVIRAGHTKDSGCEGKKSQRDLTGA